MEDPILRSLPRELEEPGAPQRAQGGPHLLPLAITTGAYAVAPLLSQALSKALLV